MFLLMFVLLFGVSCTDAYFTLPGKCPGNIPLSKDFELAEFFGTWHQHYYYASDGQQLNNCSKLELETTNSGIYMNISRIDRGLFHRFSIARVEIPSKLEDAANMSLTFTFDDAPRRLMVRSYPFRVLAVSYKYFASVYTCQYSPLINRHFIYVWILSRNPILNDVSKERAMTSLAPLGIKSNMLIRDDGKCIPKYWENKKVEPVVFRTPVPIQKKF